MSEGKSVKRRTVGNWIRDSGYTECHGGEENRNGTGNHIVGVVRSVVSEMSGCLNVRGVETEELH